MKLMKNIVKKNQQKIFIIILWDGRIKLNKEDFKNNMQMKLVKH